jgi:hypothetical protein
VVSFEKGRGAGWQLSAAGNNEIAHVIPAK